MHSWVAQCGGGPYYSPQWYCAAPPRSDALRPWAWPRATGGRRGGGGGGGRWRAAGPEPGRAMAASERLYELWLLYNAQVRPPRPRPPCSPRPAPRACCTCAPRATRVRADARALSVLGLRTHVCAPSPAGASGTFTWATTLADPRLTRLSWVGTATLSGAREGLGPSRPGTSPFYRWGN